MNGGGKGHGDEGDGVEGGDDVDRDGDVDVDWRCGL